MLKQNRKFGVAKWCFTENRRGERGRNTLKYIVIVDSGDGGEGDNGDDDDRGANVGTELKNDFCELKNERYDRLA